VYSGSSWATEIKTLTASDAAFLDFFGTKLVCSADGSIIVVGVPSEDGTGGSGAEEGKVYVYSGSSWATETMLTPAVRFFNQNFGTGIACSTDGSIIVAGDETIFTVSSGTATVFTGSSWATRTTLTASDTTSTNNFGAAVALSADGSILAVGASGGLVAAQPWGKVYVDTGSSWATETILTASDAANNDEFGRSVALSADGSILAVGAFFEDGAGTNRGKVYVYVFSSPFVPQIYRRL
jgi:hypothetical protein